MKNLYEYVAVKENLKVDEAKEFIFGLLSFPKHEGDCNNKPQPCGLCTLEAILVDYGVYTTTYED